LKIGGEGEYGTRPQADELAALLVAANVVEVQVRATEPMDASAAGPRSLRFIPAEVRFVAASDASFIIYNGVL